MKKKFSVYRKEKYVGHVTVHTHVMGGSIMTLHYVLHTLHILGKCFCDLVSQFSIGGSSLSHTTRSLYKTVHKDTPNIGNFQICAYILSLTQAHTEDTNNKIIIGTLHYYPTLASIHKIKTQATESTP
jgi:hypothetical protein